MKNSRLSIVMLILMMSVTLNEFSYANSNDSLLFYASFEKDLSKADYANGWDRIGGGGFKQTQGYKGKAVDLRVSKLENNFWRTENSYLPHFTQWVFFPRSNLNYRQGTLEFYMSGLTSSESNIFDFLSLQQLRPSVVDGRTKYFQPFLAMSNGRLRWLLVSLKGVPIEGNLDLTKVPGFNRRYAEDQWIHFTMQWSPDGFSIYLDGRLVKTQRLDDDGLAFAGHTHRGINMQGIVLDEFKIYNAPKYSQSFEPFSNGPRPNNAFPGVAGETALPNKKYSFNELKTNSVVFGSQKTFNLKKWSVTFDEKTGYVTKISNGSVNMESGNTASGLEIWKGLERTLMLNPSVKSITSTEDGLIFNQIWGKNLVVTHELKVGNREEIYWDLEFSNKGKEKLLLETLMGLPVSGTVKEYFDMSWVHTQLDKTRRRDEYANSLPFVAFSNGRESVGVGIDPHFSVSSLIGEWIPAESNHGAKIRQGTQVVLNKNETQKLRFIIVKSSGFFGAKDAVSAYHEAFPDLYQQKKNTSIYSYMPTAQHFRHVYTPELSRQFYIGNQWGHLPYHTKGDFLGRERFWGRADLADDPSYQHAKKSEGYNKNSIQYMRNSYLDRNKQSFYDFYTPIRTHDNPNNTAAFIVRETMPGIDFNDDPLSAGQYYLPNFIYVNEAKTPLGDMFREDMLGMTRLAGKYSTGITNDLSHRTAHRFNDEFAKKSPGRAFGVGIGEYLVAAVGIADRYKYMDSIAIDGKVRTMWSDYGGVSYSISAYSAATAIESGEWFYMLGSQQIPFESGRTLLGEKPMALLTSYGLDEIGKRFKTSDFTSASLRDYYRFGFRRLMLSALQAGYYMDPMMLHGKLWNFEANPVLVESLIHGRKTVSGVKGKDPLWAVRGGDGGKDIIVVGNSSVDNVNSEIEVFNQYFDSKGNYIWVPFYGGQQSQRLSKSVTRLANVTVGAHDILAFKPVAKLIDVESSDIKAKWEGDGLSIKVTIELDASQNGQLEFILPAEYYSVASVKVNDKNVSAANSCTTVSVGKGKNKVEAVIKNTVLNFSSELWGSIDFIKDGNPNFVLLANNTPYEKGTANQFNLFIQQYDEEDGIEGNLKEVGIYNSENSISSGFKGWKIDTRPSSSGVVTNITIDSLSKTIKINGKTQGEVRRATMLLMRLVDRKYPHIGRFIPMGINIERGYSSKKTDYENSWKSLYNRRAETTKFFEDFEDKYFLSKPILEKGHEPLYVGGNKNFEGKYQLRVSPYLFEPTYFDNFIYGYTGKD